MGYDLKDIGSADQGRLKIEWAEASTPVLRLIKKRFQKEGPLAGKQVTACLHVTTESGFPHYLLYPTVSPSNLKAHRLGLPTHGFSYLTKATCACFL